MNDLIAFPTRQSYLNDDDFYTDGVVGTARKFSRELDLGVWHREGDRPHPVYRVTYVVATHEVIAVCLGGRPMGQIEVIASGVLEDQVEVLLDGWAEKCGAYSMPWIRSRLIDFPPRIS